MRTRRAVFVAALHSYIAHRVPVFRFQKSTTYTEAALTDLPDSKNAPRKNGTHRCRYGVLLYHISLHPYLAAAHVSPPPTSRCRV